MDLKPFVQTTYLPIIKGTLDRILIFEIDSIMNHLVRIHLSEPSEADEKLIITHKFEIYRRLWKGIIETLYEKFLPSINYSFNWEIEITPYTIMLCKLSEEGFEDNEIELQKKLLKITSEDIENDFESIITMTGLNNLGFKDCLNNRLPEEIIPSSKVKQLSLLMRLMNFPPLGELALFVNRYNSNLKNQIEQLAKAFSFVKKKRSSNFWKFRIFTSVLVSY
jgi:hypothetical protein